MVALMFPFSTEENVKKVEKYIRSYCNQISLNDPTGALSELVVSTLAILVFLPPPSISGEHTKMAA
jgi:hypothetical protein